ncbi:Hypothetical predicted protein [Paramuricea clavata]|uniref:Uncharacterized protein n=1 Tax=Paramuricea clavata TaxID=317549 RepID=A0A6S7FXP1_PARCT|nr:Hypothetical predicted protein [Paramuricea clavata]
MENSEIFKTMKRQWNILITGSYLDGVENSGIFKTMKRQWNILITGSWLDDMENTVLCEKYYKIQRKKSKGKCKVQTAEDKSSIGPKTEGQKRVKITCSPKAIVMERHAQETLEWSNKRLTEQLQNSKRICSQMRGIINELQQHTTQQQQQITQQQQQITQLKDEFLQKLQQQRTQLEQQVTQLKDEFLQQLQQQRTQLEQQITQLKNEYIQQLQHGGILCAYNCVLCTLLWVCQKKLGIFLCGCQLLLLLFIPEVRRNIKTEHLICHKLVMEILVKHGIFEVAYGCKYPPEKSAKRKEIDEAWNKLMIMDRRRVVILGRIMNNDIGHTEVCDLETRTVDGKVTIFDPQRDS